VAYAGKYFLEDRICCWAAFAGFGMFPRFVMCQRVKPSALRIRPLRGANDDFGGITLCSATSSTLTYIARCTKTQQMRRTPSHTHPPPLLSPTCGRFCGRFTASAGTRASRGTAPLCRLPCAHVIACTDCEMCVPLVDAIVYI